MGPGGALAGGADPGAGVLMTPTLAKIKQGEVERLHESLEPHARDKHVALAQQSLRAAAFWLSKAEEMTPEVA